VFSKLREQVCTTICPYGRMQGVLLDRNSIVVAYDYIREKTEVNLEKMKTEQLLKKEIVLIVINV
jgi:polyferredoxin